MYTNVEDMDLGAMEREAFTRGDTLLAGLAAFALDASTDANGELADMEKERDEAIERADDVEKTQRDMCADFADAVNELNAAIDGAKRIGNREAIEAALHKLNELTN